MKKLSLLFVLCMVSMLAFAQTDSPADSAAGGGMQLQIAASPHTAGNDSAVGNDSASDNEPPPSNGVALAPSSANLGNQAMGDTTIAPFTLSNAGSNNITITSITATPSASYSIYNIAHYTCTNLGQLPAGQNCSVLVASEPSALGPTPGTLTIRYEEGGSPSIITAALNANGIYAVTLGVGVFPPHHITCNYYLDSSPCTVTLVNQLPVVLTVSEVSVSPHAFHETNNCVGTVAPFGSCTIELTCPNCFVGEETPQGTLTVNTTPLQDSPPPLNIQGCRIYGC